ncbi:B3 domain-containing protein At5g42700-like isoform X2 [Andrographis paniculata]|uniref:B3 domain-containing protein At5g42700-like isoform X2 n=1 Tax=Andrographis paniculata TaxID=175694 RepID=UPI0021E76BD6|nr:B3 domain-containing protein At5g42700-like isoform X2 [Andrographis paniculata]
MSKEKYEAVRQQRLEENRKRMEQLHLPLLSQALRDRDSSSPKSTPMKRGPKPRAARKEVMLPVRRSQRFTNKSATNQAVVYYQRVQLQLPRRIPMRDTSSLVYASDEARQRAVEKAEKVESELTAGTDQSHPTFVKSMLPSHVSGGFWLGLSSNVCKKILPKNDGLVTLADEQGDEWSVVYLARKNGLSGGWKKFAVDHKLADGDALVFQLIRPAFFKVFITRVG